MSEENKEIQVVTGDACELNISKVSQHLTSMKPKTKEQDDKSKKKIIVPEVKKIEIPEDDKNA